MSVPSPSAEPPGRATRFEAVQRALDEGKPKTALAALGDIEREAIAAGEWDAAARAIATRVVAETGDRPPDDPERLVRLETALAAAPAETRPVLEAILANWTWGFFQVNRWRFAERTAGASGGVDEGGKAAEGLAGIASWDLPRVVAEIRRRFAAALEPAERLQTLAVADYGAMLEPGTMPDNWRPTVWDVVVHDALAFATSGERGLVDPEDAFEFDVASPALGDRAEFLDWRPDEDPATTDTRSPLLEAARLHRALLRFHAGDADRTALLAADLDRILWASQAAVSPGGDDERDDRTRRALATLLADCGTSEVAAMVRFQLAFQHRRREDDDALLDARKTARAGAEAHPDSVGGRLCRNLVAELDAEGLELFTESVWADPWPVIRARYRNLTRVHLRLVAADVDARLRSGKPHWQWLDDADRAALLAAAPVRAFAVDLPATPNLRDATHDIPVPRDLPPGAWWLIASADDDFGGDDNVVTATLVRVTRLAIVARQAPWPGGGRVIEGHVVDVGSGLPVAGAKVELLVRAREGNPPAFVPGPEAETDADGAYRVEVEPQREHVLRVSATIDGARHEALSDPVVLWDQPPAQTHERIVLVSDRGIHRPGQIVRFKGILGHADTVAGDYRALADRIVTVTFRDANGRELLRREERTNAVGSFHGEVAIPMGALPGQWMVVAEAAGTSGFLGVRVEEYKRPKYRVELSPPAAEIVLDRPVALNGKATTYTGLAVSQARVRWHVERLVRFPVWCRWLFPGLPFDGGPARIARGTATTDADGRFSIEFPARPDRGVPVESLPVFSYRVVAEVTDPSGETRVDERLVRAGYAPLAADVTADAWQAAGAGGAPAEVAVTVATESLDGIARTATGRLTVRRLVQPEKPLRPEILPSFDPPRPRRGPPAAAGPAGRRKPAGPMGVLPPAPGAGDETEAWEEGEEVFGAETTTDAATGKAVVKVRLPVGIYRAEFVVENGAGPVVKGRRTIEVIDPAATTYPVRRALSLVASTTTASPGGTFEAIVGTGHDAGRCLVEVVRDGRVLSRRWTEKGRTQWPVTVPVTEALRGGFTLRAWMVRDGRLVQAERVIDVPWTDKKLDIAWERFTRRLEPGAKEVWRARIRSVADPLAGPATGVPAEVVATLYDQSLDALAPHAWPEGLSGWLRHESSPSLVSFSNRAESLQVLLGTWRIDQVPAEATFRRFRDPFGPQSLGVFFGSIRRGMPMERGAMPMAEALSAESMPAEGLAMRGVAPARRLAKGAAADAASALGDTAGDGGQGGPAAAAAAPPPPRRNLVETAFFLPSIESGADGAMTIEFALPDTLTTWRFKALAHDARLRSKSLEESVIAARDLMVEPVVPRFVREGDVVEIPVKLGNRSTGTLAGRARFELFDARTGDSRADLLDTPADQPFDLTSGASQPVVFRIRVPDGTETLRYLATASAGRAADGEEAFLPVLSRRVLVDETVPITLRGPGTRTVKVDRLAGIADHPSISSRSLVVQATSNPAWYAVLALPSIAEAADESVEALFTRLYANAWAGHIARRDERIAAVFARWREDDGGRDPLASPLETNGDLLQTLLAETPWVRDAVNEKEARHRIGLLFEANRAADEQAAALRRLEALRAGDGGWPWFPGGRTCAPVTLGILSGFGRLRSAGVDLDIQPALATLPWLDGRFVAWRDDARKAGGQPTVDATVALALYARSFFAIDAPPQGEAAAAIAFWHDAGRKTWPKLDARRSQGHLAIALARSGDRNTALSIVDSLRQRAVDADVAPGAEGATWQGMWWRDRHPSWWRWAAAPIETQAVMIEAFDEVAGDRDAVEALKVWLLSQKRTSRWRGDRATADAIGALLGRGEDLLASNETVTVTVGDKAVEPGGDDAARTEPGSGFVEARFTRREIEPRMAEVSVSRKGRGLAFGGVHWQYLDDIDALPAVGRAELAIDKRLFVKRLTKAGPELVPAADDGSTRVEVGDEIVVRLVVTSDRDHEFLELVDHRPSLTEPIDVLSGWRWADGTAWYLAIRDASTRMYFERLPRGTHVFEYSLRAAHRGSASSGFAMIRSRYAPEFSAHSASVSLEVE